MNDEHRERWPESAKLADLGNTHFTVLEFLNWLEERGVYLCSYQDVGYRDERLNEIPEQHVEILNEFFEIDTAALDRERNEMLEVLRNQSN